MADNELASYIAALDDVAARKFVHFDETEADVITDYSHAFVRDAVLGAVLNASNVLCALNDDRSPVFVPGQPPGHPAFHYRSMLLCLLGGCYSGSSIDMDDFDKITNRLCRVVREWKDAGNLLCYLIAAHLRIAHAIWKCRGIPYAQLPSDQPISLSCKSATGIPVADSVNGIRCDQATDPLTDASVWEIPHPHTRCLLYAKLDLVAWNDHRSRIEPAQLPYCSIYDGANEDEARSLRVWLDWLKWVPGVLDPAQNNAKDYIESLLAGLAMTAERALANAQGRSRHDINARRGLFLMLSAVAQAVVISAAGLHEYTRHLSVDMRVSLLKNDLTISTIPFIQWPYVRHNELSVTVTPVAVTSSRRPISRICARVCGLLNGPYSARDLGRPARVIDGCIRASLGSASVTMLGGDTVVFNVTAARAQQPVLQGNRFTQFAQATCALLAFANACRCTVYFSQRSFLDAETLGDAFYALLHSPEYVSLDTAAVVAAALLEREPQVDVGDEIGVPFVEYPAGMRDQLNGGCVVETLRLGRAFQLAHKTGQLAMVCKGSDQHYVCVNLTKTGDRWEFTVVDSLQGSYANLLAVSAAVSISDFLAGVTAVELATYCDAIRRRIVLSGATAFEKYMACNFGQ